MSLWELIAVIALCWVPVSFGLACLAGRGLRRAALADEAQPQLSSVVPFPQFAVRQPVSAEPTGGTTSLSV